MSKRSKNQSSTEDTSINYWRSTADLLMCLMLLLFLLLIIFMYRSNQTGDASTMEDSQSASYESVVEVDAHEAEDSDAGENDEADEDTDAIIDYADSEDVTTTGEIRAAIKIISKDLDTDQAIQAENLHFQLRNLSNRVLQLSVYYPDIQHYDQFATMEDGTVYLPEKISEGSYMITSMDAPEGYQTAEAVTFKIDQDYEWNKPYEVVMYFALLRNEIHLCVVDAEDQVPLEGVAIDIIATKDTVNPEDGETYQAGAVIGSIVTGSDGTADSEELPLGDYELRVTSLPDDYAYPLTDEVFTLVQQDAESEASYMELSKTQVAVSVLDELTAEPISGISISVSDGNSVQEYQTDEEGQVLLTDLEKGANYTVTQTTAAEDYQLPTEPLHFSVDQKGWINSQITTQYTIADRMIQMNFSVESMLFGKPVAGQSAVLTNASGQIVEQWTTGEQALLLRGLEPGAYTFTVGNRSIQLTVDDIASVQTAEIRILSTQELVILAGGALLFIAFVVGLIFMLLRRRKK